MSLAKLRKLSDLIQKQAEKSVWSSGVALGKKSRFFLEGKTEHEYKVRVELSGKVSHPLVQLWPEDEDFYCDCGDPKEPCVHICAAASVVKADRPFLENQTKLTYKFLNVDGKLLFKRFLKNQNQETEFTSSLTAYQAGIKSGRNKGETLIPTQGDYKIDEVLHEKEPNESLKILKLFRVIRKESVDVFFEGKKVNPEGDFYKVPVELRDDGQGLRLIKGKTAAFTKVFKNAIATFERMDSTVSLYLLKPPRLQPQHKAVLEPNGFFIQAEEIQNFVEKTMPILQEEIDLQVRTHKLQKKEGFTPYLSIEVRRAGSDLVLAPHMYYGDPPLLEIRRDGPKALVPTTTLERDEYIENLILKKLSDQTGLELGKPQAIKREEVPEWTLKIKNYRMEGNGKALLRVFSDPKWEWNPDSDSLIPWSMKWELDGEEVEMSMEQVLKSWHDQEESSHIEAPLKGLLPIPDGWLKKNANFIEDLLTRIQAGGISDFERDLALSASLPESSGSMTTPSRGEFLLSIEDKFKNANVSLPEGKNWERLRPYQKEGVKWLLERKALGLGALLADEMGLGKTIQSAMITGKRTLIACPTSVISNWIEALQNFRPELKVVKFHGTKREWDSESDVIVTSYALLRIESQRLQEETWDTIILDESQTIKNSDTMTAQSVYCLKANFRLALSGTPLENRLSDLGSQLRFLAPGLFGDPDSFDSRFREIIPTLRNMIEPFVLKRTKDMVLKDLPSKTETISSIELSEHEIPIYAAVYSKIKTAKPKEQLELLLRLRQAATDVRLLPEDWRKDLPKNFKSAKTKRIMEMISEIHSTGKKCLLFSQWTQYLDMLEAECNELGITYTRLDGSTSNREAILTEFKSNPNCTVLLLSLKAGGVGLNLTEADNVILSEPWWNPATEAQAVDRVHRIGQTKPVFVYRMISDQTVEKALSELQKVKKELSAQALENLDTPMSVDPKELLDKLKTYAL